MKTGARGNKVAEMKNIEEIKIKLKKSRKVKEITKRRTTVETNKETLVFIQKV